jgi:hypothetical protein
MTLISWYCDIAGIGELRVRKVVQRVTMLSENELETLLRDLESDRVERKASLSDKDDIRQAICAFANDLPGHNVPGLFL